eukprot:CAMPEP_0176349962 /NCGR_PEP_ID=MMETSP0126-20121128/9091_1 /TAXON_ID=141414 ORGANISM="Strombidinopsis acuminatum, Strain SPMC142" /NCGR_SAMPLE_ID=MMETSP0126 /ASSEMBLY_ACC=CAM_ASM_000229 /LENGTH=114 /DNA_ID=CAMNT_0017699681 /DNA_START=258 /DNA_END=602 /DNA_ORIENTATION=+
MRQYRHMLSEKPTDRDAYLRQIKYRCGYIGTKEIEILLRDYLHLHSENMSYEDLSAFDDEVLNIENPQLQRYFVNGENLLDQHDTKYLRILKDYVLARKEDYYANVPSEEYRAR